MQARADFNYPFLTLKERDNETGLDYFISRYHSPLQGRFTGVDPSLESAEPGVPQSWNRYLYVLNNPLILVDPDGKNWFYVTRDGKHYWEWYKGDKWTDPATNKNYTSSWTHLAVIEIDPDKKNSDGAKQGTLTIYGQNWNDKVVLNDKGATSEDVFIGGTQGSKDIRAGEYFINLNVVAEKKDAKAGGPGGLHAFYGFQFIPQELNGTDPTRSWGHKRAYLSMAGWQGDQPAFTGDMNSPWYLHGHGRSWPQGQGVDLTDGCVGTKSEVALGWMEKVIRGQTQGVNKVIPVTVRSPANQ